MSELDAQIDEADDQVPEDSRWIERLSGAVSDYEVMGAEDAAGLSL
ncbi:hypothetical protein [Agrilutibacter solisilvae]|uniref:Uncharacterized protein n=1 Tax=Agrilutibacter solisilvae TaxID=2763317 RepID=A0A974XY81_9GAMM|nr:hypothetical protein [Lysobacter solisilvae]QSX77961.1 hypothetical protein I8J32_014730 [Lysobacter solisilvae]